MTYRVLVTDDIDADGVALLASEPRLRVDEVPTLPKEELYERIADYDAIVGRSATRVSEELLRRATRLKVVGRAGVGVDNIALDVATELGVAVINAPAGNTIAVAELFFGSLISLFRHIPRANESMHAGRWDRSQLLGTELKGRTIGIVGLGRIGGEVATRAHAFGMNVVAYDPYIPDTRFQSLRVRRAPSLEALLGESDILTVHVPLTEETTGMIGRGELSRLPTGAVVCNLARGGIVADDALAAALDSGKLAGAVLDVYVKEPLTGEHQFRGRPNVILTPHIGASTSEAQHNVAVEACRAVRDALLSGELSRSINVANSEGRDWSELRSAIVVAQRAATVARAILASQGVRAVQRLTVRYGPDLAGAGEVLAAAAAVGALEGVLESGRLNMISARALAGSRGIEIAVTESSQLAHPASVEVSLAAGMQELAVGGVAPRDAAWRLTRIGGFHVDVAPREVLIVLTNNDVPGVIGHVGTVLGEAKVNIAEYHQARLAQGGEALAAITVDPPVSTEICRKLLELPDVLTATIVRFGSTVAQ
ncbi:MAG TPA: phosphoglycerate dehydrogenase [Gemmatimonadaceae bacterium]|nr:phosphoglycerate dehydrogenase [Gemmatimonadaceae bacterium]